MLKEMRQNTKTVLWIVIVAFVGLIIVGWGMQQRTGGGGPEAGYVGEVDGARITTQAYSRELQNQRAAYAEQYGRPRGAETEQAIMDAAWDAIIRRHILFEVLDRWNISASDEEVLREIQYNPPPSVRSHPAFMTDSLFDHQKYLSALADPRADFSSLEDYVRQTLPFTKLEDLLAGCVRVTDEEVMTLVRMFQEKAVLSYVRVSPYADVQDLDVEPSDAELEAYYNENMEEFRIPDKRVLEFVRFPKEPGVQDRQYARERIEEAYDLIQAGDSFKEIAAIYSDDEQSAPNGGDMGWVVEGRLPPDADSVIFDLAPGEVSDIIEIHNAHHIFTVTDTRETDGRREARLYQVMTLADVSPATLNLISSNAEDFAREARDRGMEEAAAELQYLTEEADQVTFEAAAHSFGVEEADMGKVFAAPEGKVVGPLDGRGAFFVIQVSQVSPSHIPSFEEARDLVEMTYVMGIKTGRAREIAEGLAADVEAGKSLETAAEARGLRVRTTQPFTRLDDVPGIGGNNEITAHAFALEQGGIAGPLENAGSFFVIRVDQKESYDEEQIAEQMDNIRFSATMSKQQAFLTDWYEDIRSEVDVKDYREAAY